MSVESASTIFIQQQSWRIGSAGEGGIELIDLTIHEEATSEQIAEAIEANVDKEKVRELILALPSEWCLCASINARPEGRGWRRELLFELEEQLPLAAEDVVGDFIVLDDRCIGICTEVSRLRLLIDALESRGFYVGSICPAALLALQNRMSHRDAEAANAMLWSAGGHVDMFLLKAGKPIAWHVIPSEPHDVANRLKMLAYSRATEQISLLGDSVSQEIIDCCLELPNVQIMTETEPTGDLYQHACDSAALVAAGKLKPIVDLRRDALASRYRFRRINTAIHTAIACFIIMLFVLGGSMLWMSYQYEDQVNQIRQQLNVDYKRGLPSGRPTERTSVMTKELEDELSILQAQSGNASGIIQTSSALRVLTDLVSSYPQDVHFRLLKLRISANEIRMEGEAQTHQHPSRIVEAISRSGKFDMDPPRTASLSGRGVSFNIRGTYKFGGGRGGR